MRKEIKKDVYTLLTFLPTTRRSDDTLVKVYCDFKKISTNVGDPGREHITIADIKTIVRYRRKHQQDFPNLYPTDIQQIREQERKEFKKEFKNGI